MLVPVVLRLSERASTPVAVAMHDSDAGHTEHLAAQTDQLAGHAGHLAAATSSGGAIVDALAVGVHTLAMFLVMGVIAVVVFERVGLAVLRRAWFNLDRIWAGTLIAAGGLTLVFAR
jgi:hypothetical protein